MRFLAQPAIAGIFAALVFTAAPAYTQVVGGSIGGTVTDSSGAAVSGATVVIHNQETGSERQLTTNGEGVYSAPSVPVGRYSVTAARDNFATQHRDGVVVTVGQSVRVNVALSASAVSQNVEVTDKPAPVNLTTQQTSGLVDERQVKNLPLNGRSYDQLLTLNPATVNYTAQRSGSIGTSNSSVGNMFSVSGRRPQDNLYLLNGVEYTGASLINVTPGGTSGQLLGVDAVREFNVSSDTYSAAFGKRQGAQISIVTASGTNQLHGAAYEFLRNSALDARNYFDQQQIPEFQRNNFGGSLGGPIRRNKIFLFGNYEGYRQNLGLSNVALVPDANARQGILPVGPGGSLVNVGLAPGVSDLLKLWPTPNGPELTNAAGQSTGIARAFSNPKQTIREDFGTARADYNLSAKDLLFGVYTIDDSTAHTPTANPFAVIDETLREQVASIEEQHVFSSQLLNTARVGFSRASFYFLGSYHGRCSRLCRRPARRRHRHLRLHCLQRRLANHRRRRQRRQQQRRRAQPLHARRPCLLDASATISSKSADGSSACRATTISRRTRMARPPSPPCKPSCRAPSRPSPSSLRPRRSTGAPGSAPATSKTSGRPRRVWKSAPASASKAAMAGMKPMAAPQTINSPTA